MENKIKIENDRNINNLGYIYLFKDGNTPWYKAYEWSAYLCEFYNKELKTNERLNPKKKKYKFSEDSIINVSFQLSSTKKFLPNLQPINDDEQCLTFHINLDELNLSSWDTSKVTTIYEAFCNFNSWNKYGDYSIPKINLPKIPATCNTDHAFSYDYSLTTIESSGLISKSINLQWSPLTHDSALVLINALDSEHTGTLTLSTSTYNTLTDEDKAIATNKGWAIAA